MDDEHFQSRKCFEEKPPHHNCHCSLGQLRSVVRRNAVQLHADSNYDVPSTPAQTAASMSIYAIVVAKNLESYV